MSIIATPVDRLAAKLVSPPPHQLTSSLHVVPEDHTLKKVRLSKNKSNTKLDNLFNSKQKLKMRLAEAENMEDVKMTMEINDEIEIIDNKIGDICADGNKKVVEDFLKHAGDGIDGFGHQKVWKMKKVLAPKNTLEPPTAKKDSNENLISDIKSPILNSLKIVSSQANYQGLIIFDGFKYTFLFLFIIIIAISIIIFISVKLFTLMTKDIDEFAEIKKDNRSIALLLAVIIFSVSIMVKESLYFLIETFVPYPEVINIL